MEQYMQPKELHSLSLNLAGGEILKGVLECYPEPIEPKEIRLRFERVDRILGYQY